MSDLLNLALKYNPDFKMPSLDRIDILCGPGAMTPTVFPCEKCHKESCAGKRKCKGFGAYTLGVRIRS